MGEVSDTEFARLAGQALDELPAKYARHMQNVAIVYADEPTDEQRKKLALRGNETLFGLYEGVPLTARGASYNLVLPDKITIFKLPLVAVSHSEQSLKENIKRTLWHEIAHHFGLDHNRIDELERRRG